MFVFSFGRKAGFTMIELMVVILILGVLSSIALPQYRRSIERARVAEALPLLRAVYDSCERLAWENQYQGQRACQQAIAAGVVKFSKLDITAKGTFVNNGLGLKTDNFTYMLNREGAYDVSAERNSGDYATASIGFDGRRFVCCPGCSDESKKKICSIWGSVTWNE